MKAVIYSRVSTEEQASEDRHSLAAQKRLCNEFATREGYEVVKIFEDAGKSGTTMKRPALIDMLAYIDEQKDIKALLVQDTDRIARNTHDHLGIRIQLQKTDTKLISISQPMIDSASVEGKMIDTILASFNEFQSGITARKTSKGMEQKAINGWYPCTPPLGYKNTIDEQGNKIIVIDDLVAPLVKEAYSLYVSGNYNVEDLNDYMYQKGLRGRNNGKKLQRSKMAFILQNPFYIGQFKWGGKTYPGKHEPLISKDLFDMAQEIRTARICKKNYQRKHKFLLTGFIYCAKCGRKFTAEHHFKPSGRQYSYYHCTRGKKCTNNKAVSIIDLEKQVEQKFKEIQFTKTFYLKLLKKLGQKYDNFATNVETEVTRLNKQKVAVASKRDKMEQAYFSGTLDDEAYQRNAKRFKDEIDIIEAELLRVQNAQKINLGEFEELVSFAQSAYCTYKHSAYAVRRRYLAFFFESFIVDAGQIVKAQATPIFAALQEMQKPKEVQQASNINSKMMNLLVNSRYMEKTLESAKQI